MFLQKTLWKSFTSINGGVYVISEDACSSIKDEEIRIWFNLNVESSKIKGLFLMKDHIKVNGKLLQTNDFLQ
jgi:hypothetical protein